MIDVTNSSTQSVNVYAKNTTQEIEITNVADQEIGIGTHEQTQSIDVENAECAGGINISIPCPLKAEIKVAIDSKVPKALSILPKIANYHLGTNEARETARVFIDANGTPSYATLEQIKQLGGTKTIYVDELTDGRIKSLSKDDTILLRSE